MACNRCGAPCNGGLCHECELERLYGDDETVTSPRNTETEQLYECTVCGDTFMGTGDDQCPEPNCDSHRRRYIGDLEAHA